MAAMERLTYAPLIEHLKSNAAFYNHLYADYEIRHGTIDNTLLQKWLVQVVEPILACTGEQGPDALYPVFKVFYSELLSLISSGLALSHEEEYRNGWSLCSQIPHLVTSSPVRIVRSLNAALQTIRGFQPARTMDWINMMKGVAGGCQTVEQFLHSGRIAAWFCGLAHLKAKASEAFELLPFSVKGALQKVCPLPQDIQLLFSVSWFCNDPQFVGEAGGFTGFGGPFVSPPLVAQSGKNIVATDSRNVFVLLADSFGRLLLPGSGKEEGFNYNAGNESLKTFTSRYGDGLIPFDDLSSCVLRQDRFVFTRKSSHYIYLYGWQG